MKFIAWAFAAAALVTAAQAETYVAPGTAACLKAVDEAMEKDATHDAYLPSEFLDNVRILMWLAPYSKSISTEVSTVIMIEGIARLREDHTKSDPVTAQCGLTDDKVLVVQVLPGHGLPEPEPGK